MNVAKTLSSAAAVAILAWGLIASRASADPLPSWNDTAPKRAIVAFVERVTTPGSDDFVAPAERIAVFDNDGTLWADSGRRPRWARSWRRI